MLYKLRKTNLKNTILKLLWMKIIKMSSYQNINNYKVCSMKRDITINNKI